MPSRVSGVVAASAAAILLVSVAGTSAAEPKAPTGSGLIGSRAVTTRLLAQQGLAVGFTQALLHDTLALADVGRPGKTVVPTGRCLTVKGVHDEVLVQHRPSDRKTVITNRIFYDAQCRQTFVTQRAIVTPYNERRAEEARTTSNYRGPGGRYIGRLVGIGDVSTYIGLSVTNVGAFTPSGQQRPISLGLLCGPLFEPTNSSKFSWDCTTGIAQQFTSLKKSLGSIALVKLSRSSEGRDAVHLAGKKERLRISSRPMAVGFNSSLGFKLTGRPKNAGADSTMGHLAKFSLLPGQPTGWTITDTHTHTRFSILVGSSRNLIGKVVDTKSKAVLATIAVDRSGTGTITYRGSKPVRVAGWVLTG